MVSDSCMDLLNSTGELEFAAKRCVQCGEVVDQVIIQNRTRQQEMLQQKNVQVAVQSIGCQQVNIHPSSRRSPSVLNIGHVTA